MMSKLVRPSHGMPPQLKPWSGGLAQAQLLTAHAAQSRHSPTQGKPLGPTPGVRGQNRAMGAVDPTERGARRHDETVGHTNPWRDGSPARPRLGLTWQVAIGVALGSIVAFVVIWQFTVWRAQVAAEAAARHFQDSLRRVQTQADQLQQAAVKRQQAEARARVQRAVEAQRLQEAQAQARARDSQARDTREEAFRRSYVKPKECQDGSGDTVACANHYIRARRELEV